MRTEQIAGLPGGRVWQMEQWGLVGRMGPDVKTFGPFRDADDARDFCNSLGLSNIEWDVARLHSPGD